MLVEEPGMTWVIPGADDMDVVCLVRLHWDRNVDSGIHQSTSWCGRTVRGLTTRGLICVDEIRHFLVVPVEQGERDLLVEMEGRVRVMNDKRAPEAIRILPHVVRVIPIAAWLIDLKSRISTLVQGRVLGHVQ